MRSANERTAGLCLQVVKKQVPENHIFIVKEKPFSHAVVKTFELGINQNNEWTLALDADIILTSHAVEQMVRFAETLSDQFYVYQGVVLDKLFGDFRSGGPHLYRTKYLSKALTFIPHDGLILQPESYTYKRMAENGFHFYFGVQCFGVHDYLQYYKDVYRKSFVHAKKHQMRTYAFLENWSKSGSEDKDFEMALLGYSDGLAFMEDVEIDTDFFQKMSEKALKYKSLKEKDNDLGDINQHFADKIIEGFEPSPQWEQKMNDPNKYLKRSDVPKNSKPLNLSQKVLLKSARALDAISNNFKSLAGRSPKID